MYLLIGQETSRIRFREVRYSDFDFWLPFFEDPSSFTHWQGNPESPAIECEKWFDNQYNRYTSGRGGMNALIEKESDSLIGYCGVLKQLVDEQSELEIAYSLLPEFRGKGFATEAARYVRDFSFTNNFGDSLISIISLTNHESANVALKNGMIIEKQTRYKDNAVNIFRITKKMWENSFNSQFK